MRTITLGVPPQEVSVAMGRQNVYMYPLYMLLLLLLLLLSLSSMLLLLYMTQKCTVKMFALSEVVPELSRASLRFKTKCLNNP
jgi:hypothetical protein